MANKPTDDERDAQIMAWFMHLAVLELRTPRLEAERWHMMAYYGLPEPLA